MTDYEYAEGLSALIRKETISEFYQKDKTKFYEFHELLKSLFPNVFNTCELEDFDGSILLKWKGKNSDKPIVLMNHHDVVEAGTDWTYPPFSGEIVDGKLFGRGTLDTKGGLYCMLEAAEELIKDNFVPNQDIYFESACTEEVDGGGCDQITKVLLERGIKFDLALDEGGMIIYDPIGGADGFFAMIGVGEKNYADVRFTAKGHGGHASTPEKNTPLVRLGKFMVDVESSNIFETKINDVTLEMLKRMAPTMKPPLNLLLRDPYKIDALLNLFLPALSPTASAMLRTTIAFTMAEGASSTNVIPDEAHVIGNMRFSHHQGAESSIKAITGIANKYDIEVKVDDLGTPSHISSFESDAFKLIEKAISKNFENVIPAPYVTNTASDCRYMSRICDNCIRFTPFIITDEQLESIHGVNENVDISCLTPAVNFYKYIMTNI